MSLKYIIVDLESTERMYEFNNSNIGEIIEIGAVKIENNKIVDSFDIFIKPEYTKLTPFISDLTSIIQKEIESAYFFKEAYKIFNDWIDKPEDYVFISCGNYDYNQLKTICNLHNISFNDFNNHLNLKELHAKKNNYKKHKSMKKMLDYDNIKLEGNHHRGIDDAYNLAKIFINLEK